MGAAAKILASTVTYPYQVVKSRLQQRDPITLIEIGLKEIGLKEIGLKSNIEIDKIDTNKLEMGGKFDKINMNENGLERGSGGLREVVQPRYTGTIDCIQKIWR